ncbi:MAG: hypothetical protein ACOC1O_00445 [bacterium]
MKKIISFRSDPENKVTGFLEKNEDRTCIIVYNQVRYEGYIENISSSGTYTVSLKKKLDEKNFS